MRMPTLILTALAAILLTGLAGSQDHLNPKEQAAKRIKDLQQERIATLKKVVDYATTAYQSGGVPYSEVLEANLLVLKAELDGAEKASERIGICKNIVEVLKTFEKTANAEVERGQSPVATVFKIKARRLEAEIQLERAKVQGAEK